MEETNKRFEERTDRYRQNFKKYGYSEMSMDMPSDRRVIRYLKRNFTTDDISDLEFDYAVSSQTFTIPYTEKPDNYETIFSSVEKLFKQCRKGVSFNFFTDKGQFQRPGTAYHDPVEILRFAYTLSTNVILDNSCFPYECTLTILKDNACSENGMIFDRFLRIHQHEFEDHTFVVKKK